MDASAWIAQQRITVIRLFSVAGAVVMAKFVMRIRRARGHLPSQIDSELGAVPGERLRQLGIIFRNRSKRILDSLKIQD
jgi:hypothetical protein